jgi:UDP-N-acetylmuramyl pentapeptide synthase
MAKELGVKTEAIKKALESIEPIAGRLQKVISGSTKQNFVLLFL